MLKEVFQKSLTIIIANSSVFVVVGYLYFQWILFSAFVPLFASLQCYFYTIKYFPWNSRNSMLWTTCCTYTDLEREDEFYTSFASTAKNIQK